MALIDDIRDFIREEIGEPLQAVRLELTRLNERAATLDQRLTEQTAVAKRLEATLAERLEFAEQRRSEQAQHLGEKLEFGLKPIAETLRSAQDALAAEVRGLRGEIHAQLQRVNDATVHAQQELTTLLGKTESQLRENIALSNRDLATQADLRAEFQRLAARVDGLQEQFLAAVQLRDRLTQVEAALAELKRAKEEAPAAKMKGTTRVKR